MCLAGYTRSTINADFRMRYYPDSEDLHHNRLVGVSGLIKLVGAKHAEEFVRKAYERGLDKTQFRLRRGIMIEFAGK